MKTLFTGLNGFKCNKNISVCRLASYRPCYKSRLTVCCGFPLEGSKVQNSTADTHTTLPLSLSKNQTDGWNRFIFDVSMCVCFHMYMCEFYMYMSEIINVFLLISCLVRFTFTLSQSPCWVSLLALTWKEKVRHTHTHTHVLRWESIKVIALSSKCPVWQRSHRRSNLFNAAHLVTEANFCLWPPDRFELWPLPLRTLPLSPFFFLYERAKKPFSNHCPTDRTGGRKILSST